MSRYSDPEQLPFDQGVLDAFQLPREAVLLPGGSRATFRVGHAVPKRIRETSLESTHSPRLIQWLADISATVPQDGFRLPRPLRTTDGQWITPEGWTAWTFVEGRHATGDDVPACIAGIQAFHRALHGIPKHPLLDDNTTPWGKADRWCWGERPAWVHPVLAEHVDRLYALRRPVSDLQDQLIHGDLNPENVLIAPGVPPAFLDMAPFWRPPEFALGMFANWIGPRRGDVAVLRHFTVVPQFDQMLVRAAIRMLLVMSELGDLDGWDTCSEKRAAELVLAYVGAR